MIESSKLSRVVIADATCLIILTKIDSLTLLRDLYKDVRTTPEVEAEYGEHLPDWIQIDRAELSQKTLLESALGLGERSAILLALLRTPSLVILDDLRARVVAQREGLDVIGTLGVLLEAKQSGLIASVRPFLTSILETNFRLSDRLIEGFLRRADEEDSPS